MDCELGHSSPVAEPCRSANAPCDGESASTPETCRTPNHDPVGSAAPCSGRFDWSEVNFNILFVPGAVRQLLPFTSSLLQHSDDCRFRLVSNGCTAEEDVALKHLAESSPRFDFYRLPWTDVRPHGEALNKVHGLENSDFFAFLDSDILATGPFLADFEARLTRGAALFSCPPVWSLPGDRRLPDGFRRLPGACHELHDGFTVGTTYFAIYDNRILSECMSRTGIRFDQYQWNELPESTQSEFQSHGLERDRYDTGKVLNMLLALHSGDLHYVDSPHLNHIGGMSARLLRPHRRPVRSRILRNRIARSIVRRNRPLLAKLGLVTSGRMISDEEVAFHHKHLGRRNHVCRHLWRLINALASGEPFDEQFSHDDPELAFRIQTAESAIRACYADWTQ